MPVGETEELPSVDAPEDQAVDDEIALVEPAAAPRDPWRGRFTFMAIAAGLFFVLAVAMTLVAVDRNNALSGEADERDAVTSTAGRLAEALMAYDYRHLDEYHDGVLALATGSLRNQFEDAFDSVSATITEFKATTTATVNGIFVDIGDSTASAIVVVEQVVTSQSGTHTEPTFYLQLDLVRVDKEWKVDNVTNLNFAVLGNSGGQTPTDSSTSTTLPAETTTTG